MKKNRFFLAGRTAAAPVFAAAAGGRAYNSTDDKHAHHNPKKITIAGITEIKEERFFLI